MPYGLRSSVSGAVSTRSYPRLPRPSDARLVGATASAPPPSRSQAWALRAASSFPPPPEPPCGPRPLVGAPTTERRPGEDADPRLLDVAGAIAVLPALRVGA